MGKLLLITSFLLTTGLFAQQKISFEEEKEGLFLWSKDVVPLDSDTNSSSFLIRIKEAVKPHYHAKHTETIYILNGSAEMQLGGDTIKVTKGDYIHIPPNTIHSVKVTSIDFLDVLSIQAPKFEGEDRIWVEE